MLVGYMRVSTADERQSVDLQRDALVAAGVDERHLHQDRASGAKDDRPGLKACLADLRHGDILIVWKLDRLGRSLSHLLTIITDLKNRGVAFRSITEQMDTTTPHGEFLFNVFGSLAQFERALIRERVNAGLAAAKRRGRIGGRPRSLNVRSRSSRSSPPLTVVPARPRCAARSKFRDRRSSTISTGSVGRVRGKAGPRPTRGRRSSRRRRK